MYWVSILVEKSWSTPYLLKLMKGLIRLSGALCRPFIWNIACYVSGLICAACVWGEDREISDRGLEWKIKTVWLYNSSEMD